MAVRIFLAEGGVTVFNYATLADRRGESIVVYEWNRLTNTLDELVTFPAAGVIKAEVMKGPIVSEVILGLAPRTLNSNIGEDHQSDQSSSDSIR